MTRFACAYLGGEVELTDEREKHIAENHPELLPQHRRRMAETLADPDEVRCSLRSRNAYLVSRWFENLAGGKHIVVVVMTQQVPNKRNWMVTAYISRRLTGGKSEWKRS